MRNSRTSTVYLSEMIRQAKTQLLLSREEYVSPEGKLDRVKLSAFIRKALGLVGEGWDGHNKYYLVQFEMLEPAIMKAVKEIGFGFEVKMDGVYIS